MANYIRFDWAMKRLLRDKANFTVLEGLVTTLLGEKITIHRLLESESNQESEYDKYNRVDILAEDSKGVLILLEIQNNNEYAYFQRMLFGVSKLLTEYINRGEGYRNIRKVYSINIVYFALGSGTDTVYHGKTEFRGLHTNELLRLSPFQQQTFQVSEVSQLYPNIIFYGSMISTVGQKFLWNNGFIFSTPVKFPVMQRLRGLWKHVSVCNWIGSAKMN